ncbi:MAG TPA: 23S rRNA (pseudouridine(1915)-N(3))-methyltransferase RlmH, partial [Firmicutes bacterium]|nr:23S rRNA (pseudouridine(1915)-N(3))-methyltransferase RlmH [Bacillota bacterium]
MIKINLLVIGSLKEEYLKNMSNEYIKRLSKFTNLNIIEFKELELPKNLNSNNIDLLLEKEDEQILKLIKKEDYLLLLDLHGKSLTSENFANLIDKTISNLRGSLIIAIGGTLGVSKSLVNRANFRLKLSDLTFTHQFSRVIILEQLYRAFKIINNEAYHH